MITSEFPSGGHGQLLFDIRQCLADNEAAVADLGDGRAFLAGQLLPLVQYGAEHGEDRNELHHLVVAIGAAGLSGDTPHYRLTLVRFDPESDDQSTGYVTIGQDVFHTVSDDETPNDFDEGDANDWRLRLSDARFSVEASWFHISSKDESQVVQAANWGDEDMQQRLGELGRRVRNWRELRQVLQRYVRTGESPLDYDY